MDTSIEAFQQYLVQNRRFGSADTYGSLLRGFEDWLETGGSTLDGYRSNDVETYVRHQGLKSPYTANTFLAAIRSYQKWRTGSLSLDSPMVMPETQRANQLLLIKPEKIRRSYQKMALVADEVGDLLKKMERDRVSDLVYAGTVLTFYFGARPVELARNLANAEIHWDDRWMLIQTAKSQEWRILAWDDAIAPHLMVWYDEVPRPYPDWWLTRHLGPYTIAGVNVTSKTGRRSFETEERMLGVDKDVIDLILGHANERVGDIYTDWSRWEGLVRDVLENRHYLLLSDVL
jgi:site-specific recombinase XerD